MQLTSQMDLDPTKRRERLNVESEAGSLYVCNYLSQKKKNKFVQLNNF